ncbi:MAG: pyrroline-5-carboxylate reductase [Clostridiales bacterium]|nr:pyrroline-5-carboxylate reductase [Clostridiales bacterium]MBS5877217.1 pyrroline-5-carboxylate reductase [Clostridiales bacterium]MDU0938943.1 pyrroline-5-carboxylate reductase [Clostridiales bacterium]MDU1041922.1 pyrroline-5-carboxylate reductase [Clostridiales bacterium]MDU3490421.1 pyrroline-5-carboxylate reductase [Clostridiales bacterium]
MDKIAFIGMGNMGQAMLKGALSFFDNDSLCFYDHKEDKRSNISDTLNVLSFNTSEECVKASKYIILSIKPQVYESLLHEISKSLTPEHIVISLAPTFKIEKLKEMLPTQTRVIRAMPNTPAMVGEGMTGLCIDNSSYSDDELKIIENFFSSFGRFSFVKEDLMSAVVCVSGSSPAYAYVFIEALADSVVKYGLSRKDAYEFAAQTLLGSAKMVLDTGIAPSVLKDNVCSPGGTTIRAIEALEENGFRNAIFKATKACYDKCEGED